MQKNAQLGLTLDKIFSYLLKGKEEKMKKIVSLLIILAICAGSCIAYADGGKYCGSVKWEFNNDILTLSGTGKIEGYSYSLDKYKSTIKEIIIENGITGIQYLGLEKFTNLQSLKLPDTLKVIDQEAFSRCKFSEINIPYGVKEICGDAFGYCENLEKIIIPDSVETFKDAYLRAGAFVGCTKLKNVTLSKNLTKMSATIFAGCISLESISIPPNVTEIGLSCFKNCRSLKSVYFEGNRLDKISQELFYNCNSLVSINIPDSVTEIERRAFYGCSSLKSITIPSSTTLIDYEAFSDCKSLKKITIPQSVAKINGAFLDNSNMEITILNPTCNIGTLYDNKKYALGINPTIYGYDYSTAEAFAREYGYTFISLGEYKESASNNYNASGNVSDETKNESCSHQKIKNDYRYDDVYSQIQGNDKQHTIKKYYDEVCADCGETVNSRVVESMEKEKHDFVDNKCRLCGYKKTVTVERIQLATPQLKEPSLSGDTYYTTANSNTTISWKSVANAQYYSVIRWASEYDRKNNTNNHTYVVERTKNTNATIIGESRTGTYAYSIYACSDDHLYIQSEPCSFNIKYEDNSIPPITNNTSVSAKSNSDIGVTLNGKPISFDVPPQIINNRTMVPLRAIFEALGAQINWYGYNKIIRATKGNKEISMQIGNNIMSIIDEELVALGAGISRKQLDSPPIIVNDRTLVPLRAISEAFGCSVDWNNNTKTAIIAQ